MSLNKELINDIIKVTSKAAISCYDFIGKNQKKNADKAATDSMRNEINKLSINGEVVIRPMMYLAMSYDHRLLDGKEAVTFLVSIKEQLESPERLLLNL